MKLRSSLLILLFVLLTIELGEGKTKKKTKQLALQTRETNVVNFVRLVVMRLVFGVASALGLRENLSGVLGGIFVPPGADDYGDYGGDDDYTEGFL
ncbi:uncharacterized protein LOC124406445 [Diprion similis]|uniref:uncharacterized protein LOC124406445 n=1 Tax=Diprion similis TaxID=362088 RepID=UPI001EF7A51E|nr:uncharacterized protein LOC124406445 [Diprion similis]